MQSGLAVWVGPFVCSLLFTSGASTSQRPASPWLTDYETARTAARAQGRPIFAVFT